MSATPEYAKSDPPSAESPVNGNTSRPPSPQIGIPSVQDTEGENLIHPISSTTSDVQALPTSKTGAAAHKSHTSPSIAKARSPGVEAFSGGTKPSVPTPAKPLFQTPPSSPLMHQHHTSPSSSAPSQPPPPPPPTSGLPALATTVQSPQCTSPPLTSAPNRPPRHTSPPLVSSPAHTPPRRVSPTTQTPLSTIQHTHSRVHQLPPVTQSPSSDLCYQTPSSPVDQPSPLTSRPPPAPKIGLDLLADEANRLRANVNDTGAHAHDRSHNLPTSGMINIPVTTPSSTSIHPSELAHPAQHVEPSAAVGDVSQVRDEQGIQGRHGCGKKPEGRPKAPRGTKRTTQDIAATSSESIAVDTSRPTRARRPKVRRDASPPLITTAAGSGAGRKRTFSEMTEPTDVVLNDGRKGIFKPAK
jgi:hypothetical protein